VGALSDSLCEKFVTGGQSLPFFRSRRQAWKGRGRTLPEWPALRDYIVNHPAEVFGADVLCVAALELKPIVANTGFARPLCGLDVRTLQGDRAERRWALVAKWCAPRDWRREVDAYAFLQLQEKRRGWRRNVARLLHALESLHCLLYLRVGGDSLQTQWRQAMAGSKRQEESLWVNLSRATEWLKGFQRSPVADGRLPIRDWNREVCQNAVALNRSDILPGEVDIGRISHWLDECETECPVLCHGDFKLHNLYADSAGLWVFDLEELHVGHRYEDVSAMLMSIANQCRLFPHRRALCHEAMCHFLRQYAAEPFVDANHLLLSMMSRFLELLFWGTGSRFNPVWWTHVRWIRRLLLGLYRLKTNGKVRFHDLLSFLRTGDPE